MCHNEDFDQRIVLHNIIKMYENRSSIIKSKNNMFLRSHLSSNNALAIARQVTSNEVNLIRKSLNIKNVPGTDKIQTKLVNLALNFLSKPLATAIKNSLAYLSFLTALKSQLSFLLIKKADDKYDISNFRPVSLPNVFLKVYENIIKCRLIDLMYNIILPLILAYKKSYNTQYVMIRLLEEWRENLDKNYVVGGILIDLSKAFDCVPHDL